MLSHYMDALQDTAVYLPSGCHHVREFSKIRWLKVLPERPHWVLLHCQMGCVSSSSVSRKTACNRHKVSKFQSILGASSSHTMCSYGQRLLTVVIPSYLSATWYKQQRSHSQISLCTFQWLLPHISPPLACCFSSFRPQFFRVPGLTMRMVIKTQDLTFKSAWNRDCLVYKAQGFRVFESVVIKKKTNLSKSQKHKAAQNQ